MLDLGKNAAGAVVNLSKEAGANVTDVEITLTWRAKTTAGVDYDPDVVAFGLGENGKVLNGDSKWFVCGFIPGGAVSPDGSIRHVSGDDTSGRDGGESMEIDGGNPAPGLRRIRIAVTIYKAAPRKHNFGLIEDCILQVKDRRTGNVIVKGELSFYNSTFTSVNAADLLFKDGELFVRYLGEGYNGGLGDLCRDLGIEVGDNVYDN